MSRNLKTHATGGNESGASAIILPLFAAKEALKNNTNTEKRLFTESEFSCIVDATSFFANSDFRQRRNFSEPL